MDERNFNGGMWDKNSLAGAGISHFDRWDVGPGGGLLPYRGYIGMCSPKGYGFSALLVINLVSLLAILPPF